MSNSLDKNMLAVKRSNDILKHSKPIYSLPKDQ